MRTPALLATLVLLAACGPREIEYREGPGTGGGAGDASAGAGGSGAVAGSGGSAAGGGAGGFGGASYSNAVSALNPAAFYRFEELTGDFFSEVDAPLGEIVADGGSSVARGQPGVFPDGSSVQLLGGANGAIDFGDAFDFVGQEPFSIVLFVKVVSVKAGGSNLLTKYAGSGDGWRTEIDSVQGIGLHLYVSGVATPHWAPALMAIEQTWTFLAFTRTASELCSYRATKATPTLLEACSEKGASLSNTAAAMRLGSGLQAYVDELAIFTVALQKEEIEGLWTVALNTGVN